MKDIDTIRFIDGDTMKEALAIIRTDGNMVLLCLSHLSGGDIEVCVPKDAAKRLMNALGGAIE